MMDAVTGRPGIPALINAMTVDVEDYFQVSAFEHHVNRSQWQNHRCRVEANTQRILELFAANSVSDRMLNWAGRRPSVGRPILVYWA